MRRALAVVLLASAMTTPAPACVNETGTDRFGQPIDLDTPVLHFRGLMDHDARREELVEWSARVVERAADLPDFENLNELAVATMRLGRPKPSIRLLLALERRWPGRYETATNLGTALELAGADSVALRWIREGIRRNPNSHQGSEWLHVRILEAKVAGRTGHSVMGLDFGRALVPQLPTALPAGNDGKPMATPRDLADDIAMQLGERVQFVAPRDPIVAGLFFDWGNVELAAGALEYADLAYGYAQRYGYADPALLALRRKEVARLLVEND